MIEGVVVKQLRVIPDERGHLMEMMRSDASSIQRAAPTGQLPYLCI